MLAADVNCFWALEQDQESYNRELHLPDAYIEVIINVGAPLVLESEHGMLKLPRAFVNPLQYKPLRIRAAGFCQMISMQLYPWAVKPILNIEVEPSTVHVSIRLADLAAVYGYSDQAHLIREFKSFADCTPRDFAASAPAYFELRQNEAWCDFMKQYFCLSYAG